MFNFIQDLRIAFIKSFRLVLTLFIISLLSVACSSIPLQERFISAGNGLILSRSTGNCDQLSLKISNRETITSASGLNPEQIAILGWNMYKGKLTGWQDDLLQFGEHSDIILLQEAANDESMHDFLHQSNMYWNYNSAFKYRGAETGVLIASKIRPANSCGIRENEPIIGLPKTILISRYLVKNSDKKLLVANVHGINITLGTGAYKAQFKKLKDVLAHHEGPMIIAGDFNNWTEKRKEIIDQLIGNLSLTLFPFEDEQRTTFFGDPVDHILYRGLEPIAERSYEVTSSDHNPIAVTFRLSPHPSKHNPENNVAL